MRKEYKWGEKMACLTKSTGKTVYPHAEEWNYLHDSHLLQKQIQTGSKAFI